MSELLEMKSSLRSQGLRLCKLGAASMSSLLPHGDTVPKSEVKNKQNQETVGDIAQGKEAERERGESKSC